MGRLREIYSDRTRSNPAPALLEIQQFVMSFIAHMVVPLFVLDHDGKVAFWNTPAKS